MLWCFHTDVSLACIPFLSTAVQVRDLIDARNDFCFAHFLCGNCMLGGRHVIICFDGHHIFGGFV